MFSLGGRIINSLLDPDFLFSVHPVRVERAEGPAIVKLDPKLTQWKFAPVIRGKEARCFPGIAERQGLGSAPGAVLENVVQQWAEQDAAGAAAWISAQPAGEGRDQLVGRLAYVQSRTEPAAAAHLVVEQIPVGPIQDEAALSVLHQWAGRDLAAATSWVSRFPSGALRDRARAELQGPCSRCLLS